MKNFWLRNIAACAVILALSACAIKRDSRSAGDVVEIDLAIDGQRLEEILANPKETNRILVELLGPQLGGEEGRDELRSLIKALDGDSPNKPDVPAFRGLAGRSALEFVRAAVFPDEIRRTKGLIGDYLVRFDKSGKWGAGHLSVDTRTEIFDSPESYEKDEPDRVERYQWHIKVLRDKKFDGFEVLLRNDAGYPNDPFPGTVVFPKSALDPKNPMSIWYRDLNHKLFAKGREIVILDVYRQIDDGEIKRLDDSDPLYRRTDESCIDLMTRGYPPSFRIDFPEQSGYCLGRCAHPDIYNSM